MDQLGHEEMIGCLVGLREQVVCELGEADRAAGQHGARLKFLDHRLEQMDRGEPYRARQGNLV